MEILTSLATAIGLAKQVKAAADATKDANAKLAVAELLCQLADVRTELSELVDENSQLKAEVKRLKESKTAVTFKDGLYWAEGDSVPFCPTCYDSEQMVVHLADMGRHMRAIGKWRCGVCKSHYGALGSSSGGLPQSHRPRV